MLITKGHEVSPVSVSNILKEEGFAKLPQRKDDERPPGTRTIVADLADVRQLDLSPQRFRTKFGVLPLFLPFYMHIPFDRIMD